MHIFTIFVTKHISFLSVFTVYANDANNECAVTRIISYTCAWLDCIADVFTVSQKHKSSKSYVI